MWKTTVGALTLLLITICTVLPSRADVVLVSTGNPDGKLGALSRPAATGELETETADDFVLTGLTRIDQATITGLLPLGSPLTNVTDIEVELYDVFPVDSTNPPDGRVPTRVNSPADTQFAAFDAAGGALTFTPILLNPSFSVSNTVINGIHASPNQFTGGEGPATGEEVQFDINFTPGFTLPAGHYFFRPEVALTSGNFLWLSAPKPIVAPGIPFTPDLQAWIRNTNLDPDWLRIGTDITGQGPFNMTFSLSGTPVPEPASFVPLIGLGLGIIVTQWRRRSTSGK